MLLHSTFPSNSRTPACFCFFTLLLAVQFRLPLPLLPNPTLVSAQLPVTSGVWQPGDWSACDAQCGVGLRHRISVCVNPTDLQPLADSTTCDPSIIPAATQTCQTPNPCPGHTYSWYNSSYNNDGYRGILCIDSDTTEAQLDVVCQTAIPAFPKPAVCASGSCTAAQAINASNAYFFFPTPWSGCYPYCGNENDAASATQSRYYVCINSVGESDDSSNQCWNSGLVPPSDLSAYQRPCPFHIPICTMYWKITNRSPCNAPCGGGFDTLTFSCANITSDAIISDSMCYDQSIDLPINYESCNTQDCLVKWVVGDFGSCSVKCGGGGVMSRSVQCFDMNGMLQPDSNCTAMWTKPPLTSSCGDSSCYQWNMTSWVDCSEPICGGGQQTRTAGCVVLDPITGDSQATPIANCQAAKIVEPALSQQCNTNPCAKAFWDYSAWGTCQGTVCGQTGTQTRKVQCSNSTRHAIPDSECKATGATEPSAAMQCTYLCQPNWSTSDWAPTQCPQAQVISAAGTPSTPMPCTPTIRTRSITCLDAYGVPTSDSICIATAKPVTTDSCPPPVGCDSSTSSNNAGTSSFSSTASSTIPSDETSTGSSSDSGSVDPPTTTTIDTSSAVQIDIKYRLEPSDLPSNFANTFATDVSSVLGISASRVKVTSIAAGSTVVQFLILPSEQSSDLSAQSAANAFQAAFNTPGSPLLQLSSLQYADTSSGATLTQMHTCADGSYSGTTCTVSSQTTTGQTVITNGVKSSSSRSWVLIVAIVAPVVGVILILALVCFCIARHKMRQTKAKDVENNCTNEKTSSVLVPSITTTEPIHPHHVRVHVSMDPATLAEDSAVQRNQAMENA